ncbi:hypothetical protein GUITHDRAFT_115640 [Guillardia theta CCMP2712]|uniref:Uncharacterized protein n=1 Tax=Guillardia theta (strain CCMP2712) TaxID=905079 RepID=L1IR67_GUITC|nr:hypothetical protein GUITHDRAFT_115640 [Guillardia theta CCMP2712]EKX38300.1 hypothetical protein GUITHDRAFT_115640 [Guillardia theta CCMP2712]|eukprot:XP_005825280.1 hypothetical protein GUITHDRAFT_115640 [Guillardia theta CCMP2712]
MVCNGNIVTVIMAPRRLLRQQFSNVTNSKENIAVLARPGPSMLAKQGMVVAVLVASTPCCLLLPPPPRLQLLPLPLDVSSSASIHPPLPSASSLRTPATRIHGHSIKSFPRSSPALAFNAPCSDGFKTDEPFGPLSFEQVPGVIGTFNSFYLCERCGFQCENVTGMDEHKKGCTAPYFLDNCSSSEDSYDPLTDLNDPNGYKYSISFASHSPIFRMLESAKRSLAGRTDHGKKLNTCSLRKAVSPPITLMSVGRGCHRVLLRTCMPNNLGRRMRRRNALSMKASGWSDKLSSAFQRSASKVGRASVSLKEWVLSKLASFIKEIRESPQVIQKHGISGVLMYGAISHLTYSVCIVVSWMLHGLRTGFSPLDQEQWKGFFLLYLAVCSSQFWLRPLRITAALTLAPWHSRVLNKLQKAFSTPKELALGILLFLINILLPLVILHVGLRVSAFVLNAPLFPDRPPLMLWEKAAVVMGAILGQVIAGPLGSIGGIMWLYVAELRPAVL